MVGQYNEKGERIGEWQYYDTRQRLYKSENYLIPYKEENDEELVNH
jgi:hypothetical protein